MRILIADDEADLAELMSQWLLRKGYQTDVARDGLKAMQLVREVRYAVAFLDFNLPEVTGIEIADYLRKNYPQTKTVLITGYPQIEDNFAKAMGVDEYMPKPLRLEDLEGVLAKLTHPETGR